MKKILSIGLFLAAVAGFSSCSKSTVTEPKTITFVTDGTWETTGTSGNPNVQRIYTQPMPEITQSVIDNGSVLAYIRVMDNMPVNLESGNAWASLPYLFTSNSYSGFINYQYDAGNFYVTRKDTDLQPTSGTYGIKVVLLNAVEKNLVMESGVDVHNYTAVMQVLEDAAQ